jgi:hypothetical protein
MPYLYPPPQFALHCEITSSNRIERTDIPVNSPVFYSITVDNPVGYTYLTNPNSNFQGQDAVQVGLADVKIGDWIGTIDGSGVAFLIVEIDDNRYTIADIDGWCLRVKGGPQFTQGDVCIFRVNEDSIPMFGNLSLGTGTPFFNVLSNTYDPLQWVADMVGRFASRNPKTQYVTVYQSDGTTVTGASTLDNDTEYVVASTTGFTVDNTVIIEGIQLEAPATGYNGTGTIKTIISNVITVDIKSDGTPTSFTGATLRIGSISRGRDFIVGESVYIDSTGIFRKSAGSVKISDTVGIVTSKGIPSDDWFSFRPSGKYFDTSVVPNDFFPTSANVVGSVTLTPGLKLYINPNGATPQYTSVAPTSNPYATWIMISATRAIYIAGSGGGGGGSTVVTGTVQVFDGGDPTWVSDPLTTIYPVLDCGGI